MNDPTLFRGCVLGIIVSCLLFTAMAAFGHLPRQFEPKTNCLCPDSTTITQPRSIETKPRN